MQTDMAREFQKTYYASAQRKGSKKFHLSLNHLVDKVKSMAAFLMYVTNFKVCCYFHVRGPKKIAIPGQHPCPARCFSLYLSRFELCKCGAPDKQFFRTPTSVGHSLLAT